MSEVKEQRIQETNTASSSSNFNDKGRIDMTKDTKGVVDPNSIVETVKKNKKPIIVASIAGGIGAGAGMIAAKLMKKDMKWFIVAGAVAGFAIGFVMAKSDDKK